MDEDVATAIHDSHCFYVETVNRRHKDLDIRIDLPETMKVSESDILVMDEPAANTDQAKSFPFVAIRKPACFTLLTDFNFINSFSISVALPLVTIISKQLW